MIAMDAVAGVLLCGWIVAVFCAIYLVLPAAALGRAPTRELWWPEWLGASCWSVLATILLVPPLARFHLLNWATSLLTPAVFPLALWCYRYRGAPGGNLQHLSRRVAIKLFSTTPRLPRLERLDIFVGFTLAVAPMTFGRSIAELRLQAPADYNTLAAARTLATGGRWVFDPAASIAVILARVSAADVMHVLRFLPAIAIVAGAAAGAAVVSRRAGRWSQLCFLAALIVFAAIGAEVVTSAPRAVGVCFGATAVAMSVIASDGVHRRDRWHVAAALAVAALVFAAPKPNAASAGASGYVEYDASARTALRISQSATAQSWIIVAAPEQRLEIADATRFLDIAEFVRRYGGRTGASSFRFGLGANELFVFVEKQPLASPAGLAPSGATAAYSMPNARARIQRAALAACDDYNRSHPRGEIYYEDAQLRVYRLVS
jgi:hypothetical protein